MTLFFTFGITTIEQMQIAKLSLHAYELPLKTGKRFGVLIHLTNDKGHSSWGEIAPLPKWSEETLEDALEQCRKKHHEILQMEWTAENCFDKLIEFDLLPSVSFGLESALLSQLQPLPDHSVKTSALFMGSLNEILEQARAKSREGYTSAKLKVGNLPFKDAAYAINQLKDQFRLRIDVNRAWNTRDSLHFFSQFSLDAFDYVEEPFQNPHDLAQFSHPLAIDESYPCDVSFKEMETFPTLKAMVYKPTIQGGMLHCLPIHAWAKKRGVSLILSSSFESDLGLAHIASMAHRLKISAPVGIGTYDFLQKHLRTIPLKLSQSILQIPGEASAKNYF
jgi:O-succinylbenzoate synthase